MAQNNNILYISGIEEQSNVFDSVLFTQLCVRKFGLNIIPISTKRIPNKNESKPRLLQVVLSSEREKWLILTRMKSKHLRLLDSNAIPSSSGNTWTRMRQRIINFEVLLEELQKCSRHRSGFLLLKVKQSVDSII